MFVRPVVLDLFTFTDSHWSVRFMSFHQVTLYQVANEREEHITNEKYINTN